MSHKTLHKENLEQKPKKKKEKKKKKNTINGSWLPTAKTLTLASSPPVAKTRPDFWPSLRQLITCSLEEPSSGESKKEKKIL